MIIKEIDYKNTISGMGMNRLLETNYHCTNIITHKILLKKKELFNKSGNIKILYNRSMIKKNVIVPYLITQ